MATIHNTKAGLSIEGSLILAKQMEHVMGEAKTLDAAYKALTKEGGAFDDWFIYQGGNHVAVHRHAGSPIRLALIVATQ